MLHPKYSIVQITDQLNIGGTERVAVTLCNLMHAHGHKVKMLTIVSPGPLAVQLNKEIEIKNLNRNWKWNPAFMYRLIKEIRGYDVVHVHSSYNLRYVFLAAKIFGLKKTIFFHEHFGDININQSVAWHTKYIFPKTIFIAVSNQLARWALEKVGVPANKVFVLPNIATKIAAEKISAKSTDSINLLVVSNIRTSKNLEFAITIFDELVTLKKRNYQLTIIGNIADEAYFNKIKNLIADKKIQNKISFIHDCISVQSLLPQYDIALHTATSESGPLVLIEYLAQGLPFITYATGEVVEQIKNDLPEFIMSSFNMDEWIAAIQNLLSADTEPLQKRMNIVFEKYYSPENYYQQCIAIYEAGLNLR